MKNLKFYTVLIATLFLIASGCSNKAKILLQQVTAQADSLSQLRGSLQQKSDSLQSFATQIGQAKSAYDSTTNENKTLGHQIGQLKVQLGHEKEANQHLRESLDQSLALRDSLTAYFSQAIADSAKALSDLRTELSSNKLTLSQRDSLLAEIRPWYMKWKHDATKRNFLKVLFGTGRAKPPAFPEPNLNQ